MGMSSKMANALYEKMGKKYMRKPKSLASQIVADIGSEAVNLYPTSKKGAGNQYAGYVRKLEAEKKITPQSFTKIKQPSQYLVRKYALNNQPVVEPIVEPIVPEPEPQYDDINLNEIRNKPPKSKKKKNNNDISDAEADKIAENNAKKAQKEKHLKKINDLIKSMREYKAEALAMRNQYGAEIEKIRKLKQTKANKEKYEGRIKQDVADKKALKEKYDNVFKYAKNNDLNVNDIDEIEDYMLEHRKNIIKQARN
jgi:hypothetical protein